MDETTDGTLTQRDRIEEAHGVWELAVMRVAALASVEGVNGVEIALAKAVEEERAAFKDWQDTMRAELGLK